MERGIELQQIDVHQILLLNGCQAATVDVLAVTLREDDQPYLEGVSSSIEQINIALYSLMDAINITGVGDAATRLRARSGRVYFRQASEAARKAQGYVRQLSDNCVPEQYLPQQREAVMMTIDSLNDMLSTCIILLDRRAE